MNNRDASVICEEKIEGEYYIRDEKKYKFNTWREIIKVKGESDHQLIINIAQKKWRHN